MDVTDRNFRAAHALFCHHLGRADFAALDLEFTGLGRARPSQLDTPRLRYLRARADATAFPPIQVGLTLFSRAPPAPDPAPAPAPAPSSDPAPNPAHGPTHSPAQGAWRSLTFNFNVAPRAVYYPPSARYPLLDTTFSVQGSALAFLADHNFDFQKCLQRGVSWLSRPDEARLRAHVHADLRRRRDAPAPAPLSDADRAALSELDAALRAWLASLPPMRLDRDPAPAPVTLLPLPRPPRHRRLVFAHIRDKHPALVARVEPTQEGPRIRVEACPTTADARARRAALLLRDVDDVVARAAAFRYVVDALVARRLPLVMHNSLIDLTKLYANFVDALPQDVAVFKARLRHRFPPLYDTRYMLDLLSARDPDVRAASQARGRPLPDIVSRLRTLAQQRARYQPVATLVPTARVRDTALLADAALVSDDAFSVPDGDVCDPDKDAHGFGRYTEGAFAHEAGCDALNTGLLYILLRDLSSNWDGVEGKVSLTSCGGFRSLDLMRDDDVNDWFGRDVVIVSGRCTDDDTAPLPQSRILERLVAGTPFALEKSALFPAGEDLFLALLEREDGKRGSGLEHVIANGTEIGVNVVRYAPEALDGNYGNKRRRFVETDGTHTTTSPNRQSSVH